MRGTMGKDEFREVAESKLICWALQGMMSTLEFYSKYKGKSLELSELKYDLVNLDYTVNGTAFLI